jgi:hypothetical protein
VDRRLLAQDEAGERPTPRADRALDEGARGAARRQQQEDAERRWRRRAAVA